MIGGAAAGIGIQDAWSSQWARQPPGDPYTGLDLSALDGVLDLSVADLTCRVEAGSATTGWTGTWPRPAWNGRYGRCRGKRAWPRPIFSGAAHAASGLFPNPRDWILGGTLVSGRGEIVTTGGATVKNSAGYDLVRSCFGSMGGAGRPGTAAAAAAPAPRKREWN